MRLQAFKARPRRRQFGITHRVLDVLVAEVACRARVVPPVGRRIAASHQRAIAAFAGAATVRVPKQRMPLAIRLANVETPRASGASVL
jgi:hypothetical protein